MKFVVKPGHNGAAKSSSAAGVAPGRGRAAFCSWETAKQRADPRLRPAPPPTRRQQMPARCSSRPDTRHRAHRQPRGSTGPRDPASSSFPVPGTGVTYARCPSLCTAARSQRLRPSPCYRREQQASVACSPAAVSGSRCSRQAPASPLDFATCKVRANDRAPTRPEAPPSPVPIDSCSDRPWLCQRGSQHQIFRCF